VGKIFQDVSNPYERRYYTGMLYERRAKAHMRAGFPKAPEGRREILQLNSRSLLHGNCLIDSSHYVPGGFQGQILQEI
jgi:hypothetical protein